MERQTSGTASPFEVVADWLSEVAGITKLQARGVVRHGMKDAGLRPDTLTRPKLTILVRRVLPRHLRACGVVDAEAICQQLAERCEQTHMHTPKVAAPDALLHRVRQASTK